MAIIVAPISLDEISALLTPLLLHSVTKAVSAYVLQSIVSIANLIQKRHLPDGFLGSFVNNVGNIYWKGND
jgi:hypothetical protein